MLGQLDSLIESNHSAAARNPEVRVGKTLESIRK